MPETAKPSPRLTDEQVDTILAGLTPTQRNFMSGSSGAIHSTEYDGLTLLGLIMGDILSCKMTKHGMQVMLAIQVAHAENFNPFTAAINAAIEAAMDILEADGGVTTTMEDRKALDVWLRERFKDRA